MGQVTVIVSGRSYRFECGDGEEARLQELANYVKGRIDTLTREHGHVGGERLMLMAALLITDELMDARALAERSKSGNGSKEPGEGDEAAQEPAPGEEPEEEATPRAVSGGVG